MTPPDQTALVLSGGGAYGAFSVGVMKVLFAGRSPATSYQPLLANILTGSSVGAFNAAVIAGSHAGDLLANAMYLENIWMDRIVEQPWQCGNGVFRFVGDPLDYLDYNCLRSPDHIATDFVNDTLTIGRYFLGRSANFLASNRPLRQRLLSLVNLGSFIDSQPFRELLPSVISEQNICNSQRRINITATNWVTGSAVHFCNADFQQGLGIQALMASAAIPGIFPPVQIGRDIFVDGGVVENTPLKPAIEMGATELHVIYLDPKPRYIPLLGEPNTADTLMRVYQLMVASKLHEDIETARWVNSGLAAIASMRRTEQVDPIQLRDVIRIAGKLPEHEIPYKPITIHRYFPTSAAGGQLGGLDFTAPGVSQMMEEGERVALLHDCEESECLLVASTRQQVSYA